MCKNIFSQILFLKNIFLRVFSVFYINVPRNFRLTNCWYFLIIIFLLVFFSYVFNEWKAMSVGFIIMRERELPVRKMHFQDNFLIQHKLLSISIVRLLTLIGPVEKEHRYLLL